jgi:ATP-binding cassette subfamily F protein 3
LCRLPRATSPGYDEGFVIKNREATCAYLEQIPEYEDGLKVLDVLKMAFQEVLEIERKLRELELEMADLEGKALDITLRKYSELTQSYEVKGGYEMEEKLSRVIKGLKFSDSFLEKEFNLLSGGEKTTVLLGKLLIDNPEILLLDEPTNHLDMEAVEWLEEYLRGYPGMVLIVSHDRYFLDHVVTKIIEVENKVCQTFRGNYSDYVRMKEEQLRVQSDNYADQQKKINAMEKSVKELRDWAQRSDNNKFYQRAASIQIKLDKMERIDKPVTRKQSMKLSFKNTERSGNLVIKAIDLGKRFGDKKLFHKANLLVNYGERVALIGPNGSGKTTFLRMLLKEEQPDEGVLEFGSNVRVAYLPQQITFANEEQTVLDCFREDIYILEGKAREYLSKFMFFGANVYKKVRHLSGGERIRLKLSKLLYEDINLLILDEPTNHLDTISIETIEKALESFKGTIFFISHDRYFINKVGERVVAIENASLKSYDGNYDDYKELREVQLQKECMRISDGQGASLMDTGKKAGLKSKAQKESNKKEEGKANPQRKGEDKPVQKRKGEENLETRIEELERQLAQLDQQLENTASGYEELTKLYERKEKLSEELDSLMEMWVNN